MTLLIFYITLALVVSFICSLLEAVLLSITPSYLAQLRHKNNPSAKRLIEMKEDIDKPLASILTLNTISHTVGAAVSGAQAAKVFGDAWLGVFSGVLTLLILLLSEIFPKTIGASYWRRLAPRAAIVLHWMILLLAPFVWMSKLFTSLFSSGAEAPKIRDEISAMATLAKDNGELEKDESVMLENLLNLQNVLVTKLMTPRPVLFRVNCSMTIEEFLNQHNDTPFSRVLIYAEQKDNIIGFVHRLELFSAHQLGKGNETLSSIMRPLIAVNNLIYVHVVFNYLIAKHSQLALVVDEYGDVQGLITLEDIFEHLTGKEILDETDQTLSLKQLARERWKKWKSKHSIIEIENDK